MITKSTVTINGVEFNRIVSDTYMLRKVGTDEIYTEAIDLPTASWSYEETDTPLSSEETMLTADGPEMT